VLEGLKALLKGGTVLGVGEDGLRVERSLPHGHVAAALGTIRKLALDRLILSTTKDEHSQRMSALVVAMIVDRLIAPRSKLGFVRAVSAETACSSVGEVLGLGRARPMRRSTGFWRGRRASRPVWRGAISRTACWCSTT
jgi:hypothetical protein